MNARTRLDLFRDRLVVHAIDLWLTLATPRTRARITLGVRQVYGWPCPPWLYEQAELPVPPDRAP